MKHLILAAALACTFAAAAQEDPRERAAREAVNGRADDVEIYDNHSTNANAIRAARGKNIGKGMAVIQPQQQRSYGDDATTSRRYTEASTGEQTAELNKEQKATLRKIDDELNELDRKGVKGSRAKRDLLITRAQIASGQRVTPRQKDPAPSTRTMHCVSTGPNTQVCN